LAKTLKANIDNLKKKRFDEFMGGFNLIGSKLKETYQVIFDDLIKLNQEKIDFDNGR